MNHNGAVSLKRADRARGAPQQKARCPFKIYYGGGPYKGHLYPALLALWFRFAYVVVPLCLRCGPALLAWWSRFAYAVPGPACLGDSKLKVVTIEIPS